MVIPGAEEMKFDWEQKKVEDNAETCATSKRMTKSKYVKESIDAFKSMDSSSMKTAKSITYRYGPKSSDTTEWTILEDGEQIKMCAMEECARKKKEEKREAT